MINEKINKYKVEEISKKINVPASTIYRWLRMENIENSMKFIEFIDYLEIDIKKLIESYKKRDV